MAKRQRGQGKYGRGEFPYDYVRRHVVEIGVRPLMGEGARTETERWTVISRRLEGVLKVDIQHKAAYLVLPDTVVRQMLRDVAGMERQEKRDRARERRMARVAEIGEP